jgi:hypothetical protein
MTQQQTTNICGEKVRTLPGLGCEQASGCCDTTEHQQAVKANRRGTLDIGVQPVTNDKRIVGARS